MLEGMLFTKLMELGRHFLKEGTSKGGKVVAWPGHHLRHKVKQGVDIWLPFDIGWSIVAEGVQQVPPLAITVRRAQGS